MSERLPDPALAEAFGASGSRDEELDAARKQVAELVRELDETNRGIIALHRELEAAREAEAHLAAIVRSSVDAMLSFAPDLTVTSWNPGAEALLGYPASEIVGRPVLLIVPEDLPEEFETTVKRLGAGERVAPYDSWRRREDGSLVEVAVTMSPMLNQAGEVSGFSAVLADLTDRRAQEDELTLARAEKEVFAERDRIGRDLHDLVIQRLFADGLALQAVLAMGPHQEIADRVARVVDDLDVTISEIRTTIFALQRRPQLATTMRTQLLQLAAEASEALGFDPRVHFDGPIDTMVRDPVDRQVLAVVREALSNVAKHAHASKVTIDVSVSAEELCVLVIDNGVGLGESTRRSGIANLGSRADLLGGSFKVESDEHRGTRLEWRVPLGS